MRFEPIPEPTGTIASVVPLDVPADVVQPDRVSPLIGVLAVLVLASAAYAIGRLQAGGNYRSGYREGHHDGVSRVLRQQLEQIRLVMAGAVVTGVGAARPRPVPQGSVYESVSAATETRELMPVGAAEPRSNGGRHHKERVRR